MVNFIVVGKCIRITSAVLAAIRSFTDAKCAVLGGPETVALRWSALCRRHVTISLDGSDDTTFVQAVNAIVARWPHVVLIPADCDAIRLVNRVRQMLALPITPIPAQITLDTLDDKWRFHQFCTTHGLPVPATRYYSSKRDLDFDAIVADLGLPFVVKPISLAGSTGVHIVRCRADLEQDILNNPGYEFGSVIAQKYIDGPDIDVSVLALDGKMSAFAIQQTDQARIVFLANAQLEAMAAELCRASAYHGVMHIDARIEAATGKVFLIESNPRFWASLTASVWCGLNFVAESIMPAPAGKGVRQLTDGTAFTRHPLIRPSAWSQLVVDRSERGRLLRAMAFDPPALGAFARDLPGNAWRSASERAGRYFRGKRGPHAEHKVKEQPT